MPDEKIKIVKEKTIVYTKDRLIGEFVEASRRNVEVLSSMEGTLKQINDSNVLHISQEDARMTIIKNLVAGNEKFYKLFSLLLILLIVALVVLAGAEKALKFVPISIP